MDFELNNEYKDIKMAARGFAEGEFPEIAQECDENEEFPLSIAKKACELGFIGPWMDEKYGGAGLGHFAECIIAEEFWRVDPGLGQSILATAFGAEIIHTFGSEEQKLKYLPKLVAGKTFMGTAITEPDAGSDIASASTRAVKSESHYAINGGKIFITNATVADFVLVYCLTNPDNASTHDRHSIILVETDREGFEARKLKGKLGVRASDTGELFFKDLLVPKENLIGKEGLGFSYVMDFFNRTRLYVAAHGVGVAQGAFEKALTYTKGRKQFGQPLSSFQMTQSTIAEMAVDIEAARSLYYRAALKLDNGQMDPGLIAMAKFHAGQTASRVTNEALQLHGGYGYFADYDVQRYFRDARIIEIYEGTREIEKLIIAANVYKKAF